MSPATNRDDERVIYNRIDDHVFPIDRISAICHDRSQFSGQNCRFHNGSTSFFLVKLQDVIETIVFDRTENIADRNARVDRASLRFDSQTGTVSDQTRNRRDPRRENPRRESEPRTTRRLSGDDAQNRPRWQAKQKRERKTDQKDAHAKEKAHNQEPIGTFKTFETLNGPTRLNSTRG